MAYPGVLEGLVEAETGSSLDSFSLALRHRWREDCWGRIDTVVGYRFFRFDESLTIRESLTSVETSGVVPVDTTIDLADRFATRNRFHGAEFGLAMGMRHGCWQCDLVAKTALGNLQRQVAIDGETEVVVPGEAPVVNTGGLLAQETNIGQRSDDDLAVLPELGLGVACRATPNVEVTLGYTFIYMSRVVRAGGQIDPGVNPSQFGGGTLDGPARPAPLFTDEGLWVQGLHFGLLWHH